MDPVNNLGRIQVVSVNSDFVRFQGRGCMSVLETSESTVQVSWFPLLDCYVVTKGRPIYVANVEFSTFFDPATSQIDVCAAEPLPTAPDRALRVDAETFSPATRDKSS